ncbi:GntR family transcriptional regulator [Leucobacter sp. HY1910]
MLKVSRDTVREALSALTEAGYVESRRGRYGGTLVSAELPAVGVGTEVSGAGAGGGTVPSPASSLPRSRTRLCCGACSRPASLHQMLITADSIPGRT